MIKPFTSPDFERAHGADVFHGFFGRQGGVSDGIYESLNCGPGSSDAPENVARNREIVAAAAGARPENILTLYQVHGSTCLSITEGWGAERPEADALVTDVPGLALGILTADCAPVLFYGQTSGKTVVGAAHAGWRGALGGILEATIGAMGSYGVRSEDVKAAIGPCIDKKSYEVSPDFMEEFLQASPENERFFGSSQNEDHYMFDLPGYCAMRLSQAGLKHVFLMDVDTYTREEEFFSYRRTTHKGEPDYGRQVSLIMVR